MCNALLIHMRCASHTTRTLLSTWWNIWYIKYDRLLHSTSVVYWTSSQRCLCNHRATLHSSNDKPPPLRCFVHNDSMRESSSTAEKTRAVVKARPAISCLISLLPVPRCPRVCFAPLFYFSEAVIFSLPSQCCLLFNSFCNEHKSPEPFSDSDENNEWMCSRTLCSPFWVNTCPRFLNNSSYYSCIYDKLAGAKQSVRINQTPWRLRSTTSHLYVARWHPHLLIG